MGEGLFIGFWFYLQRSLLNVRMVSLFGSLSDRCFLCCVDSKCYAWSDFPILYLPKEVYCRGKEIIILLGRFIMEHSC